MAKRRKDREEYEESTSVFRTLMDWVIYILVIVVITYVIITYVGQRTRVDGSSMETTLSDGDHLLVDKISYRFKEPERYDIIVFPYKHEKNVYYIKRIVGLPGETVDIQGGYTYINGTLLESDTYGMEVMASEDMSVTLGEGEYFVLGDNRNHSADSREPSVGVISREDIMGKAWVRIYPFDHLGVIKHS